VFIDKAGRRQAVRYQMVPCVWCISRQRKPEAGTRFPDDRASGAAQAWAGDVSPEGAACRARRSDRRPNEAWPESRKVVDLGVLTIKAVVPNSDAAQKQLLFLPGQLTDGIEASDDPFDRNAQRRLRHFILRGGIVTPRGSLRRDS